MKKTLAILMALTLVVTAIGVLTVAEDKAEGETEVTIKEDEDGDIVKVKVIPKPFSEFDEEDREWIYAAKGNEDLTVKVDPIHVTE